MGSIYIDLVQDPSKETQPIKFLTNELISRGWNPLNITRRHKDDWDYSRFRLEEGDLSTFKEDVKSLCIPFNLRATFNPDTNSSGQLKGGYYPLGEKG